jgi:hypothetical protein
VVSAQDVDGSACLTKDITSLTILSLAGQFITLIQDKNSQCTASTDQFSLNNSPAVRKQQIRRTKRHLWIPLMPLCETGMRTKDKVYNVVLSLIYLTLYDSGGDGCTSQQSMSIDPYPSVHYKTSLKNEKG